MKKVKQTDKDELRAEYKLADFPGGLVRGKYAKRIRASSNIVVLKPEVSKVFPNEKAVNSALLSLIEIARKTTYLTTPSTGRTKRQAAPPEIS
jgi:septum formation inhibitor-activating ATPase MinD